MIVGISLMCTFAQELYDSKYDNIDATSILKDDKQRNAWNNCFKRLAPCPSPAAQYFAGIYMHIHNKNSFVFIILLYIATKYTIVSTHLLNKVTQIFYVN